MLKIYRTVCHAVACLAVGCVLFAGTATADTFDVSILGEVEFNQINSGPFGAAVAGDAVSITFQVDSGNFVDSVPFPVRGYVIDESSFIFNVGPAQAGLQNPFPGTPFFALRNDDPAVDGFFLGTNVDGFPNGVATDVPGIIDNFGARFSVTYGNDPLPSLDIADAVGFYDFTGLTVFGMGITDGPFDAAGFIFESLTISSAKAVPEPTALIPLAAMALVATYRRKKSV